MLDCRPVPDCGPFKPSRRRGRGRIITWDGAYGMTLSIDAVDPANHPEFFGIVDGIDLRNQTTPTDIDAIVKGMDRFAVLLFRDQLIDDDQQIAFSRNFG